MAGLAAKLKLAYKAGLNVLIMGPPGTGKTWAAVDEVRKVGREYAHIVLPEDCAVAEVRGHFMPNSNGTWLWHDGPVSKIRRHGGCLILDEIDHSSPEVGTFLHAALDISPLTLPSGETLEAREDMWVIATSNMEDVSELRYSLIDRFPVRLKVGAPEEGAYKSLGTLKGLDLTEMAKRDAAVNLSLRKWVAVKRCLSSGLELKDVAMLLWPGQEQEFLTAMRLAK